MAVRTVFDIFFAAVFEMAAAFITEEIKRAEAEQAVKIIVVRHLVAGKIFAFPVAEKFVVISHNYVSVLSLVS